MAKRLWEKGEELNQRVHHFTVGDDPTVDLELVHFDLLGSAAHARMLQAAGLLQENELSALLAALHLLSARHADGKFEIPRELEDCHTAIETELVATVGEAGNRIHAGRSRNDQVMLAVRLYLRDRLLKLLEEVTGVARALFDRADAFGHQPMPGYTHFQPAMPSSVKLWLAAFGESFLELAREGLSLLANLNTNPLGAASGFGTSLPLDREMTAKLLELDRVQRNPIAVQNSRGQYELKALRFASEVSSLIEKLASDLILYSTREYGFVKIPTAFTTGSSIMPQKHNPDVIELLRGRAAKVRGAATELEWVVAKLPSNYHRDFQYTKEPLVRGIGHALESLSVLREVIESFTLDTERLEAAMTSELYATYDVYREVKAGAPFREAYRATAARIKEGSITRAELEKDFEPIAEACDKEAKEARKELKTFTTALAGWAKRLASVESILQK